MWFTIEITCFLIPLKALINKFPMTPSGLDWDSSYSLPNINVLNNFCQLKNFIYGNSIKSQRGSSHVPSSPCNHTTAVNVKHQVSVADGWSAINSTVRTWLSPVTLMSADARRVGDWSLVGRQLSADTYRARSHQLANAGQFCKGNEAL